MKQYISNFGIYEVKDRYPIKPKKPIEPEINLKLSTAEMEIGFEKYIEEVKKYKKDIEKYNIELETYNKKVKDAWDTFYDDCLACIDDRLTTDQKALIYSKAYEEGHSSGMEEIYNCIYDFEEFALKLLGKY